MTQGQQRVFILGFGSIGVLLASHLQRNAQFSVVPLLRSEKRLSDFEKLGRTASIKSLFQTGQPTDEFEFAGATCPEHFPKDWKIDNLIITTKTYQTKEALAPYMNFIHPQTNVMLVQNGLGVFEVLNDEIFVDFKPNLFQGVISHGIFQTSGFSFSHAGFGDLKISRLPSGDSNGIVQSNTFIREDATNNFLLQVLAQPDFVKGLNAVHMTYQELLLGQLEKYLVNACINPITSIVNCINGELKDIARPIFDSIIAEVLEVFKIAYKPLFDYKPKDADYPSLDVAGILGRERLLNFVLKIGCDINRNNSSSMRQDVVNLRETEVAYINGYIEKLCKQLGLGPEYYKTNQTIETLVNLRLGLNRHRAGHENDTK
ncbi:LAFA_0G06700g1_1 [Lachancea sp. 'fantastica']|nr:LAFA_0G06700g1_1 [Lachancea sp. 'fantastica']